MEFAGLLEVVGDEPVFESALLFAGAPDPVYLQRQLSRWTRKGYLHQLRRGLYALAPPYQKIIPHPFLIANRLLPQSYVSRESALASYGLIPEYVPVTTSVTTGRPARWQTAFGAFDFRHVKVSLFFGYQSVDLDAARKQQAFVALPEKALLDLVHLQSEGDSADYLSALRLQRLDGLDMQRLKQFAERSASAKLIRAARRIERMAMHEGREFEVLT